MLSQLSRDANCLCATISPTLPSRYRKGELIAISFSVAVYLGFIWVQFLFIHCGYLLDNNQAATFGRERGQIEQKVNGGREYKRNVKMEHYFECLVR